MERQSQTLESNKDNNSNNNSNKAGIGSPPALMVLASTAEAARTSNSMVLPHELTDVYSTTNNHSNIPPVYAYQPSNVNVLPSQYPPLQAQLYDQYNDLALHGVAMGDFRQHLIPMHHPHLQATSTVIQSHHINQGDASTTGTASQVQIGGAQFDGSCGAFKPFTSTKDALVSGDRSDIKTSGEDDSDNNKEDDSGQMTPSGTVRTREITNPGKSCDDGLVRSSDHVVDEKVSDRSSQSNQQNLELVRDSRSRRKRKSTFGGSCPICGVTVRTSDLQSHYQSEVRKLNNMISSMSKSNSRKSQRESSQAKKYPQQPSNKRQKDSENSTQSGKNVTQGSFNDIFASVRNNRLARCRKKADGCSDGVSTNTIVASKRSSMNEGRSTGNANSAGMNATTSASSSNTICPICNTSIAGSNVDMNAHVNNCLGNTSNEGRSDNSDKFVEYDWCGESRVRATALVEEDLTGSGFEKIKKTDENENVVIDVDVSEAFGKCQYTEADLIPCSADEVKEERSRKALRQAMLGSDKSSKDAENSKWANNKANTTQTESKLWINENKTDDALDDSTSKALDNSPILGTTYKCLICMEPYVTPLTSINCWHVHCEECWMRTLGAKKLCPQCNVITSPSDLRRIYL